MKKRFFKRVASIAIALTLMLGLFAVSEINAYAEEELPTGLEKPIVEYKEVTEEEFNKAIAESKSASENVYNEYVYGESAYKGTDSFWSQFSKPYYDYSFSRLSDSQKSLYYNLYQELYSMIEGGVDLTDNASDDKGEIHYLTNIVSGSGLSQEDAMEVAYLIAYNAPEFYFVSQYISIVHDGRTGRYGVRMGVYDGMQSGSSRSHYASLIKSKINWYLNQISTSLSAYDKEKKIHDLLIDNCHYGSSNTSYSQSCASAFLNPGGETVCAGYSEAFALLCYARGISVISITSSDHEWSQVQLGSYWYAVDVTHDDDANGSRYRYFNKSDNTMLTLGRAAHTIEGLWSSVGRESCRYDYGSEPASGGTTWYNGVNYSNVYDYNYYINTYADLKAAFGSNPSGAIEHFVNCGMNEGRQAKSTFNVQSYRNQYQDLRLAFGWNNLPAYYNHYRTAGIYEGRNGTGCTSLQNPIHVFWGTDLSPIYDYNYYNQYTDLRNAFGGDDMAMMTHFLSCGMNEGRRGNAGFDVYSYRNQYSDLRQAFGWNNLNAYYSHYLNSGRREGRAGTGCNTLQNPIHTFFGVDFSPIYDYQYYIENNPDVYRAFNGDDGATFGHFLTCGVNEGRKATEGFDVYSYRNQYADLRQAFGWNDLAKYYFHYVNAGKNEGRVATGCSTLQNPIHVFWGTDFSPVYDYEYYKNHNADLRIAFGDNDMDYFAHFLTNGMKEGRQASASFNVWTYMSNYADLRNAFGWELSGYYLHYINNGKKEGRIAV